LNGLLTLLLQIASNMLRVLRLFNFERQKSKGSDTIDLV